MILSSPRTLCSISALLFTVGVGLLSPVSASDTDFDPYVGTWDMEVDFQGNTIEAELELTLRDRELVGQWRSRGMDMELTGFRVEGDRLFFKREIPSGPTLSFEGRLVDGAIVGVYRGEFGELDVTGKRRVVAEPAPETEMTGTWKLEASLGDKPLAATLTLELASSGAWDGLWRGEGIELRVVAFPTKTHAVVFEHRLPDGRMLHFFGKLDGKDLVGSFDRGPQYRGRKESAEIVREAPAGDTTTKSGRPIIERDGKTLLWARDDEDSGATEYFDLSDSPVSPQDFDHGIGKDSIPSIDTPHFAKVGDSRLKMVGIEANTPVLGVELEGVAKAYPVSLMRRHEIVNDEFGGVAYAVLW